jgi:UDP-N-acetylmuramoyl-tripeptide--D-alanyl-D-alanine ligase
LGDLSGVRRENAQILSGLKPEGLLVVNGDDSDLLAAVSDWPGRRVTFGLKDSNDLFATRIRCTIEGTEFSANGLSARVFVPMLGRHSALNALAAIAVAREMGVADDVALRSLAKARGPEMRLQVQFAGDIVLLNDAYNANPNSMRAAIETLVDLESRGRRIAILGDMRELGAATERYHREIGAAVGATGKIDLLICIGTESQLVAEEAIAAGMPADAVHRFKHAKAAAGHVPNLMRAGDLVLLKASRTIHLEAVAGAIMKNAPRK